ncbi:TNF receptor-associated factor homolog 1b-like [Tasmannia lanceolata]|uniref:TNF receptor-associated factor homolog 1b-like n=1 Tax=Tasmannia lanceolata TaxID=3420 RepID=UPI0040636BC5
MAESASEDNGAISSRQQCQYGDSLVEWRSCDQVENSTPSTSPPYWDTDDDDDCGAKPSELYVKFTWKIENFSKISKREHQSDAFEVGGYKWYILIYPQGCDVCNHLSLFLCVANHDKLLPGWSHFAQFTIAVVNKDPKKSKYSDTLHRFWKKEHDWGWKKFMELSKMYDGFIVSDTLVIKAQVQVIREKAHRPFRCLDCQYRRELVRVYLSNVELICRRFVEERRGKLGKLIEDKVRWSSFRAFWLGVDQNSRRHMSRDLTDVILKVVVKHFFIEKEVTSTLVMDSLYSGLKALECQTKNKKGRPKPVDLEEMPAPIVRVEKDMFVLADDVLVLLERAALEPLPPKDDKGPQDRTKDGSSGEEFNKDSIERDERRLTELGRRTVEIFVLAHIFSNRIEVAYQEAVALKRQEDLIREEEAAGLAESEQKSKRGATDKEKRAKKKQAKQRRASRKGKDRGRDEMSDVTGKDKHQQDSPSGKRTLENSANQARGIPENPERLDDISDVSDTGDDVGETLRPDLEDIDTGLVNCDTDTSEIADAREASSSGMSCLPVQNGRAKKKNPSVMDDSSSTCSTDSVPSVVMNGPYNGNSTNCKSQASPSRGKNQHNKDACDQSCGGHDTDNQLLETTTDIGRLRDAIDRCKGDGPQSETVLVSLKDRIQWLEQHLVEKEEEVVSLQKKLNVKDQVVVDTPDKQRTTEVPSSPSSPTRNMPSSSLPKPAAGNTTAAEPIPLREESSNGSSQTEKVVPLPKKPHQIHPISNLDSQKPATPAKATCTPIVHTTTQQVSSAPLIPDPRSNAPVVSMVQTAPLLSRSVSAVGRLGTDPSPSTHSYVPQTYRNAIMGKSKTTISASSTGFPPRHSSSSLNPSPSCSQPLPAQASTSILSPQNSTRKDQSSCGSGFTFGSVTPQILHHQIQWREGPHIDPCLMNDISNLDIYGSASGGSRMNRADELPSSVSARVSAEEFPHLDIINYLLDEEQSIGKAAKSNAIFQSPNNGQHSPLNRQFTFPRNVDTADVGSSINCSGFDLSARYQQDRMPRVYRGRPYDGLGDFAPQVSMSGPSGYTNGHIDGMIQGHQWPVNCADLSLRGRRNIDGDGYPFQLHDYSNLACGVNGYTIFRPANGH